MKTPLLIGAINTATPHDYGLNAYCVKEVWLLLQLQKNYGNNHLRYH
jgi:hypothetical protein